jgi:hypothetical protein
MSTKRSHEAIADDLEHYLRVMYGGMNSKPGFAKVVAEAVASLREPKGLVCKHCRDNDFVERDEYE